MERLPVFRGVIGVIGVILGALISAWGASAPAWGQAEAASADYQPIAQLLDANKTAQGLALALSMAEEHAGNPPFDYLLGLAALAEKDYTTAAFAFERILIVQPDHHRARAEYARSQFYLGDLDEARRQFNRVLASEPPETVRENVEAFMAAIQRGEARQRHASSLVLGLSGGHDTNINSATDLDTLDLLGVQFQLADDGQETDDAFYRLNADGGYRYRLSQTRQLFTTLGLEQKNNLDSNTFDIAEAAWKAGYRHQSGHHQLSVAAKHSHYWLDSTQLFYNSGLEGQWRYRSGRWTPSVFASASTLQYPDNNSQNRNQFLTGFGVQWQNGPIRLETSAFGGHEPAKDKDFKVLGRDHAGINLAGHYTITRSQNLRLELGYLQSRYHERNSLFNKTRHDERYRAKTAWSWAVTPALSITASLEYKENDSNQALYSYDQWLAETGVLFRVF